MNLPNDINLEKLARLLVFSDKYEISIQFWPEQIAVYIQRDGVDLADFGGDFDFAIGKSIEYLERINRTNAIGFRPGQKFKVKNDIDREVFEFRFIDFDDGIGMIYCIDSVGNETILKETYLFDLEHC